MQQPMMEENPPFEGGTACTYDDLFPALPESSTPTHNVNHQVNYKMRVGSLVVTQVFRVPFEERKFDHSDKFGEGESIPACLQIMKDTGANIEISSSKDQSLTFLVSGKQNEVLEAKRKILTHFQTQASKQIHIPVEHHRWIVGKGGTRLKELEKQTATKIHIPGKHESSEIITVTGTKEGIEKAEHEIRVWSDEQSRKAVERIIVPKIFHPFIVGANNENLYAMMAETNARINIPPPSANKDEIIIAGEKEGVMAAKAKIEKIYKDMEKRSTTVSVEVPKSQHKYVIGPRRSNIAEILKETNVSVEMPPSDSSIGTITLRGPHDRISQALDKVYNKANSALLVTLDAPAWLHKHIIGRKGANIQKITQDMATIHVEFTEDKIKIEGPPEEVEKAQEELEKNIKELLSKMTYEDLTVDPKYIKHIIGKSGANVNRLKEEYGVLINIGDADSSDIRIEGTLEGVDKTKQELLSMVEKMENEKTKEIEIDHRYHRAIIGPKGTKIREIRDKFNQVQIVFPGAYDTPDTVILRGPKDDVDKCHKELLKLVKAMDGQFFSVEVPIFKQFHKFVIGKGGANIRKIRDETQTKIDLPAEGDNSDVITITGKKENVLEAKERIQKIKNDLVNIVTDEIVIPPKFYNSLIGSRGKLIHSITEEYQGVTVKFPSADSQSDKVIIRGPKEDVERAKQQLLELTNERQLSSYTAEVRAQPRHHKFLIGKNGANIKKIRDLTGARIVFPTDKDEDKEVITIIGKKEAVEKAKLELESSIKEIGNTTETEIIVEPRHHRHFVARKGEVLHRISDECGGVMISFPRSGVQSDRVTIKGTKDCIEAAKAKIEETVAYLEAMVTLECIIPQRHHRTVMGAKGCKVQAITAEHDVQIKFPDKDFNDDYSNEEVHINGDETPRQSDIIRITGKESNCQAAKQALLDLVPVTEEVNVPFDFHRSIIGQKGQDVRDLMNKYDVHIVLSPADQKLDIIKITGSPSNITRAKTAIEDRCKELEAERVDREAKSFKLQFEVDPELHSKIIGRRGAVITKIRTDHNVQITFPRKEDVDNRTITVMGYEKDTHSAKADIMKIVNEFVDMVKAEADIDARVHSRLIGARGRNIRKIMDEFKVDIKFPRTNDPNPNLVTIMGNDENVLEAKEHLLQLADEHLQDVIDAESRDSIRASFSHTNDELSPGGGDPSNTNGFVVKGGPWEQRAPNTASVEEFPSFARRGGGPPIAEVPQSPVSGVWGQR